MDEEIDDFDKMEDFLNRKILLAEQKLLQSVQESPSDKEYKILREENREDKILDQFGGYQFHFNYQKKFRNIGQIQISDRKNYGLFSSEKQSIINELQLRVKAFKNFFQSSNQVKVGRLIQYKKFDNLYFDEGSEIIPKQISFEKLDKYFVYPGKIIAAEFEEDYDDPEIVKVTRLLEFPEEQIEFEEDPTSTEIISIVVIAGPLTFSDSLRYSPLAELITKINNKQIQCDVLIILGPIVDDENELIQKSEQDCQDIFNSIIDILNFDLSDIQIVIVDSLKESTSIYPIPSPPYKGYLNKSKIIQFSGNPSKITINQEFEIGIINYDILLELGRNVTMKGYQSSEKLALQMKEILNQRSFIPLMPSIESIDYLSCNRELDISWNLKLEQIKKQLEKIKKKNKNKDEKINKDETEIEDDEKKEKINALHQQLVSGTIPQIILTPSKLNKFAKKVCYFRQIIYRLVKLFLLIRNNQQKIVVQEIIIVKSNIKYQILRTSRS